MHTNVLLEAHSKKCLYFSKLTFLVIILLTGKVQSIAIRCVCLLTSIKIHVCKLHKLSVSTCCHGSFLSDEQSLMTAVQYIMYFLFCGGGCFHIMGHIQIQALESVTVNYSLRLATKLHTWVKSLQSALVLELLLIWYPVMYPDVALLNFCFSCYVK